MVFADLANRASLRAFLPYLFYEADLGVDRQTIEGIVENAVAMEIDLAAVGGLDEPIIVTGQELRHAAMVLRFMRLDLTAHLADGVLNLALSRAKGIPLIATAKCSCSAASPCVLVTRMSLCSGIAMRISILNKSPFRCRVCGAMTATLQLVIRSWNFSSRLACFSTSDRIASDGSEFSKVISSGTCIW